MSIKNLRKSYKITLITAFFIAGIFAGFVTYWEVTPPQKTCVSCHEIENPAVMLTQSGHRSLSCTDCHGTAFSEGFHSLYEKGMMVVNHFSGKSAENIMLNEEQITGILQNCKHCHGIEYAKWISGGHSANYSAIFLNKKHNNMVPPNADCLRCHGMFYEGSINDLVTPIDMKGPWRMVKPEQGSIPVIPCLTCHQVHRKGSVKGTADYSDPKGIFYNSAIQYSPALIYNRYEKVHYELSLLPVPKIWEDGRAVKVSDDPRQRMCEQCHAPNAFHEAGTSDDRTPRGVHEGLSCLACHANHSNDPRQSCINCHPAISNCGLDVTKMNTTFADKNSPHNIHSVHCTDCHTKGIPQKKS